MEFREFKEALQKQFERMSAEPLFVVEVDKDLIWDTYLNAFPEGTNNIYRERREFDCSCCKQFIRNIGGVVAFIGQKKVSIWDFKPDDPTFTPVAKAMRQLVQAAPVIGPYLHYEKTVGTDKNNQLLADGSTKTWEHFHLKLPAKVVLKKDFIDTRRGEINTSRTMLERAVTEIKPQAVSMVLELIDQNSLYRGQEHQHTVAAFKRTQDILMDLQPRERDWAMWDLTGEPDGVNVMRIRNTSIGTLLVDLSEGMDLDQAVAKFEAMVAPANYKRPTALVTKGMIEKAQAAVQELGLSDALPRRHARPTDITIANVLFADRAIRGAMGGDAFDLLKEDTAVNPQKLSKVEEISIDDFINEVLPQVSKIELLMENTHAGNLMSLIAPVNAEAPNILQWGNNFSWTYRGDVTDSMKERVKAAGGRVDGVMRFSIQWNDPVGSNTNDLDAHCIEPVGGEHIYYMNRKSRTGGNLDVDIIMPSGRIAVENITWPSRGKMINGMYTFQVHNFNDRGGKGFTAEFEYDGVIHSYNYPNKLKYGERVTVVRGLLSENLFRIDEELPSTVSSREEWGIKTMQYQRVTMLMNSPNHWDGEKTGNKHYFFILENAKQPGQLRGLYNEFLTGALRDHRKVFEVLGDKMRVAESDEQLTGLGFSSTMRASIHCRVSGSFNRNLKINF